MSGHAAGRRSRRWSARLIAVAAITGLTLTVLTPARAGASQSTRPQEPRFSLRDNWFARQLRYLQSFPHLDRAYRLLDEGRLDDARRELERTLAIEPDDLGARTAYVVVLFRQGALDDVVTQCNILLREHFVPRIYIYRGLALQGQGEQDRAIEDFMVVATIDSPDNADREFALQMVADLALTQQRYTVVLGALRALASTQDDARLWLRRGLALQGLDRLEEARVALERALQRARDVAGRIETLRAIGELDTRRENWASARDAYLRAATLDPRDVRTLRDLSQVEAAAGAYHAAADWMRRALALEATVPDRERLATILALGGEYETAAREFSEVLRNLERDDDRHRVLMALGNAYAGSDRGSDAAAAFEQAAAIQGDLASLASAAHALERVGRISEASSYLARALEQGESATLRLQLAVLQIADDHPRLALRNLQIALRGTLSPEERATALRHTGFLLFAAGRYDAARDALRAALVTAPDDGDTLLALGRTYLALGDFAAAIPPLTRSAGSDDSPAGYVALAAAEVGAGRTQAALSTYRALVDRWRDDADASIEALSAIGNIEYAAGAYRDAADSFLQAAERGPAADWRLLRQAAIAFAKAGAWARAAETNEHVLARQAVPVKERVETKRRLAFAYSRLERTAEARSMLEDVVQMDPSDPTAHQNLGLMLFREGRWTAAIRQLESALQHERHPSILIHIARSYDAMQKPGMALHYWRDAAVDVYRLAAEDRREVYRALAHHYALGGQYDRAAGYYQEIVHATGPSEPDDVLGLASVYRLADRLDDARSTLGLTSPDALAGETLVRYLDELAALEMHAGRFVRARLSLQQAARIEPTPERQYLIGICFERLGQPEEAREYLRRAWTQEPSNNQYAAALGFAEKAAGRLDAAADLFERIVTNDPDYVALYDELALLYAQQHRMDVSAIWARRADANRYLSPEPRPAPAVMPTGGAGRRFQATAYLGTRSGGSAAAIPTTALGGSIPSQGGLEVSYEVFRPEVQDERGLRVFSRLLWNASDGLRVDPDSSQGGVGLSYRPLRRHNLRVSAEKLIRVGSNSSDQWLLRTLYSLDSGTSLNPGRSMWRYGLVFGDIAQFLNPAQTVYYGEARVGVTNNIRNRWLVTPHAVIDARHEEGNTPGLITPSFVEGGGGLSLRLLLNDRASNAGGSSLEMVMQYRVGRAFDPPAIDGRATYGRWVLTSVVYF